MESRKAKHLTVCTNPQKYAVEGKSSRFRGIHLVHRPLPEIDEAEIDTSLEFLGHTVNLPIFISCMTGGSDSGFEANKNLARAAQQLRIPVGLGSIRVLFEHPELFDHFHIKPLAPDVPVLANLGAAQLHELDHARIMNLLERLEVQSLVIHLNPGQELFQPEGDRNFRGQTSALAQLCDRSTIPLIVKETGFGIPLPLVHRLLEMGVSYVDLAGAGGTNWISVEAYRLPQEAQQAALEFEEWGLPTDALMALLARTPLRHSGRVLASGGIRTGMEIAKSLVLGAKMAGLALPFIREERQNGIEGVIDYVSDLETSLRAVMVLTGSPDLEILRHKPYWLDGDFSTSIESLSHALDGLLDSDTVVPEIERIR